MLIAESAKARRLKNKLVECKSNYANLEAMATEAERLHARTRSSMEAQYVSQVLSLEDELGGVVVAGLLPARRPMLSWEGLPLHQRWLPS